MSYQVFSQFFDHREFNYEVISDPNLSSKLKFQQFLQTFKNSSYRNQYKKDAKSNIKSPHLTNNEKKSLKTIYYTYRLADIPIFAYIFHSLSWHYRKGYLNKGKYLLDIYIILKITSIVILYSSIQFYLFKNYADPLMYKHYITNIEKFKKNKKIKI